MIHKWWHGFFVIWLGHREEYNTINFLGAERLIVRDETSIFCPICMKKIVVDNFKES